MFIRSTVDGLFSVFEWIMRLVFINMLWVVFTLVGLGIFGWAPATAATFTVIRKMLLSRGEDVPIVRTFIQTYRKEFMHANTLGLLILFSIIILYLSGASMMLMGSSIFPKIILIGVAFLTCVILVFIFPVFCHYQLSIRNYIRYSLTIGVANLHYFVLAMFSLFIISFVYSSLPVVMVFYCMSFPAFIIMYISLKMFNKIAKVKDSETNYRHEFQTNISTP
ncbi:YesL family protein [Halalkalibacter kiskunsagensis]|uniref:YesL family protein n=1 Tax=Halalkalibacter kiskunsagensis TaxID=1548599 RepID=A0ABV6KLZ7_9BACI